MVRTSAQIHFDAWRNKHAPQLSRDCYGSLRLLIDPRRMTIGADSEPLNKIAGSKK